ncbi:MAG: hypothetical protein JKY01_12455 [Pseudomonadales bacterium]|nr:hypothetical protein [Pseudomonadales bacterium]
MKLSKLITYTLLAGFIAAPVYAKKEHNKHHLPPGLQMKADNGGSLPPGWKKKLSKGKVLDKNIYDQGKVIKAIDGKGIITVQVDDKVVRLYKATREIVDILK